MFTVAYYKTYKEMHSENQGFPQLCLHIQLNDLDTYIMFKVALVLHAVMLQESIPVSYTHLDVYKRQLRESA